MCDLLKKSTPVAERGFVVWRFLFFCSPYSNRRSNAKALQQRRSVAFSASLSEAFTGCFLHVFESVGRCFGHRIDCGESISPLRYRKHSPDASFTYSNRRSNAKALQQRRGVAFSASLSEAFTGCFLHVFESVKQC